VLGVYVFFFYSLLEILTYRFLVPFENWEKKKKGEKKGIYGNRWRNNKKVFFFFRLRGGGTAYSVDFVSFSPCMRYFLHTVYPSFLSSFFSILFFPIFLLSIFLLANSYLLKAELISIM
jgi:hypothetical protein